MLFVYLSSPGLSARASFSYVPALGGPFYCQHIDDLPGLLTLPQALMEATSSQELTALNMLGQDFWTSSKMGSRNSSTTSSLSSFTTLHKSTSEPISIAHGAERNHFTQSNETLTTIPTSQSSERVSPIFSINSHSDNDSNCSADISSCSDDGNLSPSGAFKKTRASCLISCSPGSCSADISSCSGDENFSLSGALQQTRTPYHLDESESEHPEVPPKLLCDGKPLCLMASTDNISGKNDENTHITCSCDQQQVTETRNKQFQTDFVERLRLPDSDYFKSNLSDRLSDYEDIWRSSTNPTPTSSLQGGMNKNVDDWCLNNIIARQKMDSSPIKTVVHNNLNISENCSDKVLQKNNLQHALTLEVKITDKNINTSESTESIDSKENLKFTSSVQTQTSPVNPKGKPPPLPSVCRIKASSASAVKSPIYAEPYDAISRAESSASEQQPQRVRRRSAPTMGTQQRQRKLGTSAQPILEAVQQSNHVGCEEQVSISNQEDVCVEAKSTVYCVNVAGIKRTQSLNVMHSKKKKEVPPIRNLSLVDQELQMIESYEKHDHTPTSPTLHKFPVYNKQLVSGRNSFSASSTVADIISNTIPRFAVHPQQIGFNNLNRNSEYDNLNPYAAPSVRSMASAGTIFCKPWDNGIVENLITSANSLEPPMDLEERILAWQLGDQMQESESVRQNEVKLKHRSLNSDVSTLKMSTVGNSLASLNISQDVCEKGHAKGSALNVTQPSSDVGTNVPGNATLPPAGPPLQRTKSRSPEVRIKDYIFRLSQDRNTTFGSTIENFIQCTMESQESRPHVATRNVRQFMTGIKNYLVKHGEGQLEDLIERERTRLGSNEILNIDSIIESALHVCVIKPLKGHIYRQFVEEYKRNGSLELLSSNIRYAQTKTPARIGIKSGVSPPNGPAMEDIRHLLENMQKVYSPLKKLEYLLEASAAIHRCAANSLQSNRVQVPIGADDFLPLLIYVIVHCGMFSAEIEADYMWGLLHPSVLTGEGGYYLTSFSSAILVLKNFREQESSSSRPQGRLPSISDMQGFLKIAIPNELHDSILWKTLPVRPNMTTKDVCSLIAHKFRITNPQDYGLYLLLNGNETHLSDNDIPQEIKEEHLTNGQQCAFAYKRTAANIAWPKNIKRL
ncbi:hypothetical protein ScPMuIL_014215 [Solemya velum]